jgi:hypothetical protein
MNAPELLASLAASGVSVRIEGGALKLRPAAALDNELRDRIIELKPELLLLLSTPNAPNAPDVATVADAAPALRLVADERTERTARIRRMAQQVTPAQLLKARRGIKPALRRTCSSEGIHELLLVQCLINQGIEPHAVLTGQPAKGK